MKHKANNSLKTGSTVLSGLPFVYLLKQPLRTLHCDFCLHRPVKVFRCSGCSCIFYCNKECQTKGWKIHKDECSCMKKISPKLVPDTARMLARIIWKFQKGGDLEEGKISEMRSRRFKDLMSHFKDVRQDQRRMEHFMSLSHVLREYMGPDIVLPNETDLLGIYGRVCVNSFNILDTDYQILGTGVYLGPSIIDHSCSPNAVPVFDGFKLNIVALEDIDNLSKVRISYIDVMNLTAERKKELKSRYYFDCDCPRCHDSALDRLMLAVKCGNAACDEPLYLDCQRKCIGICSKCGFEYNQEHYERYQDAAELTRIHLEAMKEINYLDVCRLCLKHQGTLFHPLNILRVKILDAAFESSIDMGLWEDAASFGTELQIAFRKYYGENHPLLGMLLAKLGKIELHENNDALANKYLKESVSILSVSHANNLDYLRDVKQLLWKSEMIARNGC